MHAPMTRGLRLLALGALSTTAFLAGCGSSGPTSGEASKSARQIFTDAERATESASSVHISGGVVSGSDNIHLDFVDSPGRSGGTISDKGTTFQIVLAGKTVYIKGSQATMTQIGGQAAGQLLGGKWLETTTADKDFGSLSQLFDLPRLIRGIQPTGTLGKAGVTTVDGQSVIGLTDSSHDGELYVADSGPPYMVELVGGSNASQGTGTITFDHYGSATRPALPTDAVNINQLEGGSGG